MKEFAAGLTLSLILLPLALLGLLLLAFYGLTGRIARARAGVRALDHFVNASIFNGYSWESVSSHAWRERDNKRWARIVIWLTNLFQQDHCRRANKREQHVVDLVLKKELHAQTIGRKKPPAPRIEATLTQGAPTSRQN
ncbi:hypothetical protein [Allochromatium palmeri]|uniref:hypothetical protein n=1 Tax=Allochromatium palmeri TaxID=231048 RepID=UPI001FEB28A6|nr:hypothetical protein [Allochromatium palmeri]